VNYREIEETVERWLPAIPWREPIAIAVEGGPRGEFGCRLCIASRGLHASEVAGRLFATREDFDRHLMEEHPR
jgi:hypothetical protein